MLPGFGGESLPSSIILADIRLAQYSAEACSAWVLLMRTRSLLGSSTLLHTGDKGPLSAVADGREACTQEPSIWLPTQGVADPVGVAAATVLQMLTVVVTRG